MTIEKIETLITELMWCAQDFQNAKDSIDCVKRISDTENSFLTLKSAIRSYGKNRFDEGRLSIAKIFLGSAI